MPASPVTIFTPPGAGATPTAPGAIYEPAPVGKAVLAITGVATAGVNGSLIYAGLNDAKPAWSSDGTLTAGASNTICKSDAGTWSLSRGSAYAATKVSAAATPDGLTTWTVGTGSGSPILAAAAVAAAAVVFTAPAAGAAPAAPGVVFTPSVTAVTGITVTGTLAPDGASTLVTVASPAAAVIPGGSQWSETGANSRPGSGNWRELYQAYLVSTATATLEALAPKAGYTASSSISTSTQITVFDQAFTSPAFYWLYDNAGSPKWVLSGEGTMADQGATSIPAGRIFFPVRAPGSGAFVGGLLASWQANSATAWCWILKFWAGTSSTGSWVGIGTRPNTASWSPFSPATGTPTVTGGSGGLAPPVSVFGS